MIVSDVERALLEGQMRADTQWCYPCGLQGRSRLADGVILRAEQTLPVCRQCLSVHEADAYTPIAQPAYIALLRRLMSPAE